jgi:hypothetical protein
MIFSAPDVSIGGVQVLFRHQKQWSLPSRLARLEHLSFIVATQFTKIFNPYVLSSNRMLQTI